jgi:fibronectin type 3 domain-containing protein
MTVTAGQTYYYVVTAVDGSGNESVVSNEVAVTIPTP